MRRRAGSVMLGALLAATVPVARAEADFSVGRTVVPAVRPALPAATPSGVDASPSSSLSPTPSPGPAPTAIPPGDGTLRIVFAARNRTSNGATSFQQLYTANGDGSGVTRVSANDGRYYDWPVWAMNGTKIVYSARDDVPSGLFAKGEEILYLANADGSDPVRLTSTHWRNQQPKISPDGRTLIFSAFWPEYANVGIFSMDLGTRQVQNLSARQFPDFGADADPRWSPDGRSIAFAGSYAAADFIPTQIYLMNPDGSNRRNITNDDYFNTDPAVSPDGRYVAYSSYRGSDRPAPNGNNDKFSFPAWDWHLVVVDLRTGVKRVLTGGLPCALRDPSDPCSVGQSPAWVPQWSPDGRRIGFIGFTSRESHGLFEINADGSGGQPVLVMPDKVLTYWDWTIAGAPPADAVNTPGADEPSSRILSGGQAFAELRPGSALGPLQFSTSDPDLFTNVGTLPIPSGLQLQFARWTPDRTGIIFSAKAAFNPDLPEPGPPPPKGKSRHVHVTLDDFSLQLAGPVRPVDDAAEQIFMMNADGSNLRQLTTPWTEDYMDALRPGEARGNTDPDISADGRYVVFTNFSTLTAESFVLRLDLKTGQVLNLTSVTDGAVAVADSHPRFSPDGTQIAFTSMVGGNSQVFVMKPDGRQVRQLTDDDNFNTEPSWSPDGRTLVFTSYRGSASLEQLALSDTDAGQPARLPIRDWFLVTLDLRSGSQRQITSGAGSFAHRAVYSPDGRQIAFISYDAHSRVAESDIYLVDAEGATPPRPLQVTVRTSEEFVDWR